MQQIIKISTFFIIVSLSFSNIAGQFIEEVIDYKPAPGQFINLSSAGSMDAAQSITGPERGLVSLGAVGGFIVFRFSEPVVNHPDHPYGVDFTLFGNPLPEWSEPGVVWVMKDENRNGLADDSWFQLAGSDHFFSSTHTDHSVVYKNPAQVSSDIPWYNNSGESGFLVHNSYHNQPYYPGENFPPAFYRDSCIFTGTVIRGNLRSSSQAGNKSLNRPFGYADNLLSGDPSAALPDNPYTPAKEGYGGDAFDLSWAWHPEIGYIDMDTAHFVKVQTSMFGIHGEVGEISTELTGSRLSTPAPQVDGMRQILVVEELPNTLAPGQYKLFAYFFQDGRYVPGETISWNSSGTGTIVNEEGSLTVTEETNLEVYASVRNGEIKSHTFRLVYQDPTGLGGAWDAKAYNVFPNPARDYISLTMPSESDLVIQDISGRTVFQQISLVPGDKINVSMFPVGMYFIHFLNQEGYKSIPFIKH